MISSLSSLGQLSKKQGVKLTGKYVAAGNGGLIAYSEDGDTWYEAETVSGVAGKGGITGSGLAVAYGTNGSGLGRWVVVGDAGTLVAYSDNGNTWSAATTLGGMTAPVRAVAYGGGKWVAIGHGHGQGIAYSSNGKDWDQATSKGGLGNFGLGVAYGKDGNNNGRWVAAGATAIFAFSANGVDWESAATKGNISGYASGVAYGKDASGAGRWVGGGQGGLIAYSPDGSNWTEAATVSGVNGKGGITGDVRGVAYGQDGTGVGRWVAVGDGGLIAFSPDGNVWTPAATKGGITNNAFGVTYGKKARRWIVVGGGGRIAYSTDGNVWSESTTKGGFTTLGRGVAADDLTE